MKSTESIVSRTAAATFAAFVALLALSCFIRPDVTPGQDAAQYLDAMRRFQARGLGLPYPQEPLFPLFLVLLEKLGLPVERFAPLVQNALFLSGLYLFLRSLFGRLLSSIRTLQLALAIAAIPTFFIVMNGSLYTESLTATLVLVLISSFVRLIRNLVLPQANPRLVAAGWLLAALAAALLLSLVKGSFAYIHLLFCILGMAWLLLSGGFRAALVPPQRRAALLAGCAWFALVAIGGGAGGPMWLRLQQYRAAAESQLYERGGAILYGRTEYARRFSFAADSVPYLLNALSESACRRIYGEKAMAYNFLTENEIGYQKRIREGVPDAELFQQGLRNIRDNPCRQSVFAFYELARFLLHHGSAGFASLDVPLLGGAIRSLPVSLLLKLFNVLLLAALPYYVIRHRAKGSAFRRAWSSLPVETRAGTACYVLYAVAYLAVYGFATTVVRMVYPIAPFLIVLNCQCLAVARGSAAAAPSARQPDQPA